MTTKLTAVLVLAALLLGSIVASASGKAASGGCVAPGQITRQGRWEHIEVPAFSNGPQAMLELGVDPQDPNLLLATNGVTVERSVDGGCSWKTTFDLDSPPGGSDYSSDTATVVDLAVGPGHALLLISQGDAVPHVVISSYGGETWRRGDDGLETVVGAPIQAGFTANDPRYAYLLVDEGAQGGDARLSLRQSLFESTTAGGAWGIRGGSDPSPAVALPVVERNVGSGPGYSGFVPDPREGGRIFLYGPSGAFSYQQGITNQLLDGAVAAFSALDLNGGPTTLLAAMSGSRAVQYSPDGGLSFQSFQAPGEVTSFAEALRADEYYMAAAGRVFLRDATGLVDVSTGAGGTVEFLASARSQQRLSPFRSAEILTLYGTTATMIVRTSTRRIIDVPPAPGSVQIGDLPLPDPDDPHPGMLTPEQVTLSMKAGQKRSIPYSLYLPETPTPLDVFFDVDTTNSMGPAIDGLRAAMGDIIKELSAAGIDVWFGAGQYKSFESPPAYERLHDVAPAGPRLAYALNRLAPAGGYDETQLESLYQIVTGVGSKTGAGIEPGQQANWRKGSLRVVVHMTDEPISTGKPHPSYHKVASALRAEDVVHFGIAVQNRLTELELGPPLPGLLRISREAGSVAPHEGVDCDGDSQPDIYGGEPLVCVVDPDRAQEASVTGRAIINVLKAVSDIGEVEVVASSPHSVAGEEPVAVPSPEVIPAVDFKKPNELAFDVTFACPARLRRDETFPISIQARRAAGVLAGASAQLSCEALPEPKREVPEPEQPPLPPPATILVSLVPPPPAPNPPQQPNPNNNPNPNPNPQNQGQSQGAAAAQEQEQPQLAVVHQTNAAAEPASARHSGGKEEYAMSRYSAPSRSPNLFFFAVAALMSIGVGCAATRPEPTGALATQGARLLQDRRRSRR